LVSINRHYTFTSTRPWRVNHQIKIGVKAVSEQILEEERSVELYPVSGQLLEQSD